jgi:hypothetical protein
VQYSPVTGRVVAISRKLIFENPVHKDLMEKAIFERFGRQIGAQKGSFAWKKSGQQDRIYEEHQRCGVGALPLKMRNPTCKVAALFTYETMSNNQVMMKSQSLMVVDWEKLDEELALVEQSEANENAKKLEEAKQQSIPKI